MVERARLLLHELMAESGLDVEIAPTPKRLCQYHTMGSNHHTLGTRYREKSKLNSLEFCSYGFRCQPQTRWNRWTHLHLCFILNTRKLDSTMCSVERTVMASRALYIQGHGSPGIYARASCRLTREHQLPSRGICRWAFFLSTSSIDG